MNLSSSIPPPDASAPALILSETDFDSLERLIGDAPAAGPALLLRRELDRAELCAEARLPLDVVALNRWLHYVDDRSDQARRIRLVLPHEADIDTGRVSILSYVGAGLIGLKEGDSIDWPDASGSRRRLTPILVEDDELPRQDD